MSDGQRLQLCEENAARLVASVHGFLTKAEADELEALRKRVLALYAGGAK